jgi:hypothetical protein
VDVRLAGGLLRREGRGAAGDAHEYAVDWYAETVRTQDLRCGFGWSVLAADRSSTGHARERTFDPQALAAGYVVSAGRSPVAIARRRSTPTHPRYSVIPLGVGEIELSADRPDVLIAVMLPDADLLEFDYQISEPGRRSRVEGAVQRVLAFTGAAGLMEVPARGRYLRIPDDRDPSAPVLIQFRLSEPDATTTATISGLQALGAGRTRNYDTTRTTVTVAAMGAVAGSAATLAVQGLAWAIGRRLLKR